MNWIWKMDEAAVPSTKHLLLKNSTMSLFVMAASLMSLLFFIHVLRPGLLVNSTSDKATAQRTARLLLIEKTVDALERAVDHLFDVGNGVNLDAVLGLRLTEDQMRAFRLHVVDPYESRVKNDDLSSVLKQLGRVHDKTRKYRLDLTKIVQRNQPEYYKIVSFLISDGNWGLWYPQRYTDRSYLPTYGFEKTVDEVMVSPSPDLCMMEAYFNQCRFTKKCWDKMAYFFMNGYSLTHEVFFIIISIAFGCAQEVEVSALKWKNMSSDEVLARELAAVLHEAELIASADYPLYQRDLFLEQAAFGGMFGYRDFFRDEWLEHILSWQEETGCYSLDYNATIAEFRSDFPNRTTPFVNLRMIIPSLVKSGGKTRRHVPPSASIQPHHRQKRTEVILEGGKTRRHVPPSASIQPHHRQKRTEVILDDGCWAHMTAVGIIALGQYIRFLLEPLMTL